MSTKGVVTTPPQQIVSANAAEGVTANKTNVLSNAQVNAQTSAYDDYEKTKAQNEANKNARVVNAVHAPIANMQVDTSTAALKNHLANGSLNYFL